MLPLKDSNLNKQDQNLSYYRYTKGQCERMRGIEPPSPTWKEGVITIIRHPQEWTHLESNQAPNDYESFALTE
jgi:hypothetical protein